jgi:hypothetical protein
MRSLRRLVIAGVTASALASTFAVAPPVALANYHVYCNQDLAEDAACPPNGESKWWHLTLNQGWDPDGPHEVCIDEYLDGSNNGHYTTQTCYYSGEEPTRQYPEGEWGYPRAWNGGTVEHFVEGKEEGS